MHIAHPQGFIFFNFYHVLADNLLALVVEVITEKDMASSDKLDKKARRKKVAEPMGSWSIRIKTKSPLALPASRSGGPEPPYASDLKMVRVGSTSLASNGDRRSQTSQASEDIILSLPVPPAIAFFPRDEPVMEAGTFGAPSRVFGSGAAPIGLRFKASTLRDYNWQASFSLGCSFRPMQMNY